MSFLEKAISLAVEKHKGQRDKGGKPYILHPLFVMSKMDTDMEKTVAVLHDIIEDTDCTLDYLRQEGFPQEVLDALTCLTKGENEDYFDYLNRVKTNPLAVKVKKADLEHNMDLRRIKEIKDEDIMRGVRKYKRAWEELN